MDADPWAAWRRVSGWPGSVGGASAGGVGARTAFAPPDLAERFNEAARLFLAATGAGGAGVPPAPDADAARRFSEALRDLFSSLQPLTGAGLDVNPAAAPPAPPDTAALGATREHQLRWRRLSEAWRQADEAQRRLQRLWLDALRDAGTAFAADLTRSSPAAGAPAAQIRRLYDRWIDCAEDAYSRVAHGTAFCDALADAVNAGSRWRHELKALVEESAKLLDLPSRSELNALQLRLRTVEAELREARRRPGEEGRPAPPSEPVSSAPAKPRARARRPRRT